MGVILAQEGKSIMESSDSELELEGDMGKGDMEERAVLEGEGEPEALAEPDLEPAFLSALRVLVRATWVRACSRRASDRVKPRPQLSTGHTKSFSEVCERMWRAK